MKTFRTLDLAIQFHDQVTRIAATGHMKDQLFRACSSIALNLSEGNAKPSVKEKKRFYQIAYASLKETQTILRLMSLQDQPISNMADHLGASLFKLLQSDITAL